MHKSKRIDIRSRRGEANALAFLLAFPVWWLMVGLIMVLGYWYWAQAANIVGLNRSGQATAVAHDGETARREFLLAALGGYAADYGDATYTQDGRAMIAEVDQTVPIPAFQVPQSVTVKARVVTRIERFYPRPPDPVHVSQGWE